MTTNAPKCPPRWLKNVCMRLSPERNLQLGFKGDLMFKLDMEYTLGMVLGCY